MALYASRDRLKAEAFIQRQALMAEQTKALNFRGTFFTGLSPATALPEIHYLLLFREFSTYGTLTNQQMARAHLPTPVDTSCMQA